MAFPWRQAVVVAGLLLVPAAHASAEHPLSAVSSLPPSSLSGRVPTLVARVNGAPITRDLLLERLDHYLVMLGPGPAGGEAPRPDVGAAAEGQLSANRERELLGYILRQLILEQLKTQEAARLGIVVSRELLEANAAGIERQAGSREAFEEQLRQGHTTPERWRMHLQQTLLLQAVEARRRNAIPVTDEDVRRYWEKNRAALSAYFHADRLAAIEGELREMLKDARWPEAQEAWEDDLAGHATVWIDPLVRMELWGATGHWRRTP